MGFKFNMLNFIKRYNKLWVGTVFSITFMLIVFWGLSVPIYTYFMPTPVVSRPIISDGEHEWTEWQQIKMGDIEKDGKVLGTFVNLRRVCKFTGKVELKMVQTELPEAHDWGNWETTGTGNVVKGTVILGKWLEQKRVCKLTGKEEVKNSRSIDLPYKLGDHEWGSWVSVNDGTINRGESRVGYFARMKRVCKFTGEIQLKTVETEFAN